MPRVRQVAIGMPALALVAGTAARVAAVHDKPILTHDESISYLAATCHQGEYDGTVASSSAPLARWAPASAWQRFLRVERRWCFATIGRNLAATDIHPPAYFWMLHAWTLVLGVGVGVTTGAWLNAAIDALAALALFALARDVL